MKSGLASQKKALWQVVPLARALGAHRQAWDALNGRLFNHHPLLTGAFVDGLLQEFGDGTEHLCTLAVAGEAPSAMCVLKPERWLWTTFRPPQAQIGILLIKHPEALEGLIAALSGRVGAIDLMCVDPDVVGPLDIGTSNLRVFHALTMSVELTGGFDAYWAARSSNLRKNIRRYEKRASDEGWASLHVCISAPEQLAGGVLRYCQLEQNGWKGKEGTAVTPDSDQGRFYLQLMHELGATQQATVHELWLGDRLAASRLVIRSGRTFVILKTSYDEALAAFAPGRVLLKHVLQWAAATVPDSLVEFYTDASQDQLTWATDWRAIYNLRIYARNATAAALTLGHGLRAAIRHHRPPPADGSLQVQDFGDPSELPVDALALMDTASQRHGVQTGLPWQRLMAQHALGATHDTVWFLLRNEAGQLLAVLPLAAAKGRPNEIRSLSSFYTSLYQPAIQPWVRADDLVPLLKAVASRWPSASRYTLDPMDPCSRECMLLRAALERAGTVPFLYFRFGNWSHRSHGTNFASYLAQRDGATRNTLRRMGRRFARAGGYMEIVQDEPALERGIAAYEQVYANSWKPPEPHPTFLRELLRDWARRGWLRLGLAWIDGQPIAAQVWVSAHGRADIFKLAYASAYKSYSAGTLLTACLMEHVLDKDGVGVVDYLSGDDPYKRAWMSQWARRSGIVAFDPWRVRGLFGLAFHLGGRVLKTLAPGRSISRERPAP
jgi:CelD/BcsL family acetyltransferase involved in cellulose biosynthesis